MIFVRISMNVFPEKQLELMQTLISMIGLSGKEKGCRNYAVVCDIENKNCFSILQEWKTREDLDHYIASQRFGVLLGTKSLLCEPPSVQIYTVSQSEGMAAVEAVRKKRI